MRLLSPERLIDIGMGFWPAKALLSAVELDLFTTLHGRKLRGDELQEELGLSARANPDFFDTLVSLGILVRDGDGAEALYQNSHESEAFLSRKSSTHLADFFTMAAGRLYENWGRLTEALKSGERQNESREADGQVFDEIYRCPERLERFLNAMTAVSAPALRFFIERFDFKNAETLCDVGGATAWFSVAAAEQYRHLRCVSVDLPVVTDLAQGRIHEAGLDDRVQAVALDFFQQPLPQADVITMSMVLHDWSTERKKHLVRSAYEALPRGGRFAVIETLIDEQRRINSFGLLMSLNMLVEFGDGYDYTIGQFSDWCKEAGFRDVYPMRLVGPISAAVAIK